MNAPRKAFSVVEILVVIGIIGLLMVLLIPAVMKASLMGKRVQTGMEMAEITMVCLQYKQDMGQNIMTWGGGPNGQFRLCSSYGTPGNPITEVVNGQTRIWPEVGYLITIFPQMNLVDNGLRVPNTTTLIPSNNPVLLDNSQAMFFFMTGGEWCNYQGFNTNPSIPFSPFVQGQNRKPRLQVNIKRLTDPVTGLVDGRYRDVWGTPYCVMAFDSSLNAYPQVPFVLAGQKNGVLPYTFVTQFSPTLVAYMSTGVQVISAGPDMQFGPGGLLTPGAGAWAGVGFDDYANFQTYQLGSPTPN